MRKNNVVEDAIIEFGVNVSGYKYTLEDLIKKSENKHMKDDLDAIKKLSELLISHCGYFIEKYHSEEEYHEPI